MEFIPLEKIVVDEWLDIPASMIEAESIEHDINAGTLTLTFCNVRSVETIYKHMVKQTEPSPHHRSGVTVDERPA